MTDAGDADADYAMVSDASDADDAKHDDNNNDVTENEVDFESGRPVLQGDLAAVAALEARRQRQRTRASALGTAAARAAASVAASEPEAPPPLQAVPRHAIDWSQYDDGEPIADRKWNLWVAMAQGEHEIATNKEFSKLIDYWDQNWAAHVGNPFPFVKSFQTRYNKRIRPYFSDGRGGRCDGPPWAGQNIWEFPGRMLMPKFICHQVAQVYWELAQNAANRLFRAPPGGTSESPDAEIDPVVLRQYTTLTTHLKDWVKQAEAHKADRSSASGRKLYSITS